METELSTIKQILINHGEISFAYVFGSFLTRYYRPGKSDIDLGIYFKRTYDVLELAGLANDLSKVIGQNPNIDIVQMNVAGLIINHQIFQTGKLIVDFDPDLHVRFFILQQGKYVDFKRSRKILEDFQMPILPPSP